MTTDEQVPDGAPAPTSFPMPVDGEPETAPEPQPTNPDGTLIPPPGSVTPEAAPEPPAAPEAAVNFFAAAQPAEPAAATLKEGSSGDAVKELQKLLTEKGFPVTVDGQFGPVTAAAVVQAKKHLGYPENEILPIAGHKLLMLLAKIPTPAESFGEKLVTAEEAAAHLGIHEVGGNNHGPWVKKFLAEVGLPEGYAWCDAFQSYEEHGVAGKRLPIESASVEQTYEIAKTYGWLVEPPARGDLFCVNWNGPGPPFGDHIGLVVAVTALTSSEITMNTVEGNTGPGAGGSQSDGDGVYLRTRTLPLSQLAFVRIPAGA